MVHSRRRFLRRAATAASVTCAAPRILARPSASKDDAMKPSEAIEAALSLLAPTGPGYHGGLANHGPMATEALVALERPDAAVPWAEPIITIAENVQDTDVDVILAGHTHRVSNLMVGDILLAEGLNYGASYSVVQMVVQGGDVEWAGAATRVAKNLGVAQRADVKAIVDDANAQTAVLRNQVIGSQQFDILRAPTRLFESAMGNMVADAMRRTLT